ncbi:MAG TPA: glucosamine-6-phosphate deaminase [Terriglobia bacterium]|nr:glucosamine-6-phosphate deaminase [Terriglobia bacterium]
MNGIEPQATLRVGTLKVKVYRSTGEMGRAAAEHAAGRMIALAGGMDSLAMIFATGASQLAMLSALTAAPDLPWNKVVGFHMDEYLGISENHPASFRRYLRENLTRRVPMREFHGIDGTPAQAEQTCRTYAELLRSHAPRVCLLGIGENGHLAFNDPAEADFNDPLDIKIVALDDVCRQQQHSEGWFSSLAEVPQRAITLTIPTLFRVPELILSVPGPRKAHIVKRTLEESISTACPATILRTHPNATVYLDRDSAAELNL